MKNKVLKFYITAVFFFSTIVLFADPGDGADDGAAALDSDGDTTPAAIDDYVWVLVALGLLYVFMKFRASNNNKIQG